MPTEILIGATTFTANRALTDGPQAPLKRAARVAMVAARLYSLPAKDFFIADASHEELPRGCSSIAYEGLDSDYGFAVDFSWRPEALEIATTLGVMLEPINSCILGIYPLHD